MQYLPIRELENVTSALNFNTSDCRVIGGCDLYTTKAAGADKKLYKSIEQSLESQHESLIRLSESLSPPNAEMFHMNLSRASAFGSLSKVSSRRTFAYLIATLNASHPDYDFSHFLRPSDFRRERNLRKVMSIVDETLHNLRPRSSGVMSSTSLAQPQTPGGTLQWSPRMWKSIDNEMELQECEIYRFSPEEDPFDGDESAIWSRNYFFFNKERRRVLYLHFRGLSASSQSPLRALAASGGKRTRPISRSLSFSKTGASKRARFWLGDKADRCVSEPAWGDEFGDDEADYVIAEPGDDAVDADDIFYYSSDASTGNFIESEDEDEIEQRWRKKSPVRAVSESIAEAMQV